MQNYITPRIEKAIDTLLDAINNGTLAKGNCSACLVGNLIAKGLKANIKKEKEGDYIEFVCEIDNTGWTDVFLTVFNCQKFNICELENNSHLFDSTDFNYEELRQLEYAFEQNTKIHYKNYHKYTDKEVKLDQIKGLEAAIKLMLQFDECEKVKIKEVFTNKVLV